MRFKRIGVVVCLIVLLSTAGWGQSERFSFIDQHARSAPSYVARDVATLASYLAQPTSSDLEKVRSFYVWVTYNIAYDVQAFQQYRPGHYQPATPNEVLSRRKAVCQGYADLFQALCQHYDIKCFVVPGYSKGLNRREPQDITRGDHAWNAVKIQDAWYLVDATWGSGGLNEQLQFVKRPNNTYFLTPSEVFIEDHAPLDPLWQLLECPVPMSAFLEGGKVLQQALASSKRGCKNYGKVRSEYEQQPVSERELAAAHRAYEYNSTNTSVIVRAYINQAHHLMSSIPATLQGKAAIQEAVTVQEEALVYLEKAESVLAKVTSAQSTEQERILQVNLTESRRNLKEMRQALQ